VRPPQPLPGGARKELTRLLQTADSKADYRRVLCLWLRAALGLPAAAVALALGWRTSSVYNLPSRYQHEGAGALFGTGRGGRRRAWLSPEQEQRLLDSFTATAGQGGMVEAGAMCRAYEQQVGHAVAPGTIYRLPLGTAGANWRPVHTIRTRAERGRRHSKKAPPCGAHRIPTPSTARFGAALDL
jgi:transposase